MGTHPIFESDFDCLTVISNNEAANDIALDDIDQAKSIRELREIKARLENPAPSHNHHDPSEESTSESEQLGYIHMKDERLGFVDPERENYVVSRMNPGMGDMDPETRQVHAQMLFIRRVTLLALIIVLVTTQTYSILASGFDCEMEEQFMIEDPSYARTMLNGMHGNKWRDAMETYFKANDKEIPWVEKKHIVRF